MNGKINLDSCKGSFLGSTPVGRTTTNASASMVWGNCYINKYSSFGVYLRRTRTNNLQSSIIW